MAWKFSKVTRADLFERAIYFKVAALVGLVAALLFASCGSRDEPTVQTKPAPEITVVPATTPLPATPLTPPAGLECAETIPGVKVDIRYTTKANFTGTDLYGDYSGCFLHSVAAEKLARAATLLGARKPGVKILLLDALRPREFQQKLWDQVKGTAHVKYVANPKERSVHSYGLAVDVTLIDAAGKELDMGTPYDDFTPLAQPRHEAMYLRQGKLRQEQIDNRKLLRSVMREAGFVSLKQEWWHFNAIPSKTAKARYKHYSLKDLQ